jgi:hypothetical protein
MAQTYLTTEELSARIKYDPRTIRNRLKDSVLLEGVHYIRPYIVIHSPVLVHTMATDR